MHTIVLITFFLTLQTFSTSANSSTPPKKSRFQKLELFNKVLYLVETQYYRQVDTERLIQGAIKGMMDTLDPHSTFLNKDIFLKMQEDTKGEFGGLGIEVTQKDGVIIIITPIEDTPAFKAGLKPGDKIVELNHESIVGITLEQAVEKMKGKPHSKVNLGIIRNGIDGITHYEIKRKVIKIKPVKFALLEKHYAFIRLIQFQQKCSNAVTDAIKTLKKQAAKRGGLKGIILDLRSNPGGLLDEAVNTASIFLTDGIVVSTEGRNPKSREIRYVKKLGYKETKLPMIVLINGSSASASEIVAGALQDSKRAIIMGNRSFGKGSVQTVSKIDDKQGIKITIAQYMTPSGRKIQAIGIKPDIMLDEMDGEWIRSHQQFTNTLREKDLRNHLTATIETPKEKIAREKQEKEERITRIKEIERKKSITKKNKKKSIFTKYDSKKDYQVIQAINYLKSFKVFKKMVR